MVALVAPKQVFAIAQLDANDNVVAVQIGQQTNPPAGVNPGGAPGNQPTGNANAGAQAYLRVPVRLAQGGIPIGIANSGTVTGSAVGNLTLGTALPTTYSGGIFLYFPATAFSTAAAGWYFCVMTSTTVGTVYSTPASNPVSTNVIVAGSGAGYTGSTSAQTVPQALVNMTVPANCLLANGEFQAQFDFTCNNTAGTKTPTVYWNGTGGSSLSAVALTTSTELTVRVHGANQNATNQQYISVNDSQSAGGTTGVVRATVDTTAAVPVTVTLQIGTATDFVILERWHLELIPSAAQFGGAS